MNGYEYAIAPTSQFYFCGVPFRLDLSPKCDLNCEYCFAKSRGGRRSSNNSCINISQFETIIKNAINCDGRIKNIVDEMIYHRFPIHLGGMSDPCCAKTAPLVDSVISILDKEGNDYPIIISTKRPSLLLASPAALEKKSMIIQVSLSMEQSDIQQRIEPDADPPVERLRAIKALIDAGKTVVCRAQPIIPTLDNNLECLIHQVYQTGCRHIIFEYLKLPVERKSLIVQHLSEILNFDILAFYKAHGSRLIGRQWILPAEYRYTTLSAAKSYANSLGMKVSLADYGLYHLGDLECCCGVEDGSSFCHNKINNFTTVIRNNIGRDIYFSDVKKGWHPSSNMTRYVNSKSRFDDNTMIHLLQKRWNSPGRANAPDSYLGVENTGKLDAEGNVIYYVNYRR